MTMTQGLANVIFYFTYMSDELIVFHKNELDSLPTKKWWIWRGM